ncbi:MULTISPECIES: preprotein translocase subunit SecE [unclassified Microbacterium]|uniref:preprotein translocase subunit SecE n=1 Tax=unclassified Microbacterium TaxID=2609290 RepID=UPI000EA84B7A|nr:MULTISPECIES: preprotein translocase subunit SecE [unclassified Microbacterium]MBT2483282.1 preprotein translocase subunit SecE [Microbacterium sp. ISL-108]RKN66321.1 preprotein translocase subunit SecE [Microbacterium sp. CGR2]
MDQDEPRGELAAAGATREKKLGFFGSIALFIRQVISELRKVVTPTRKELFKFTAVVLVFVVIVMGIVYGLDTLFAFVTHWVFGIPD